MNLKNHIIYFSFIGSGFFLKKYSTRKSNPIFTLEAYFNYGLETLNIYINIFYLITLYEDSLHIIKK